MAIAWSRLILVVALVLLPALAMLLRHILLARRRVITEPECGQCGYCVRGIATSTCPECGSDLSGVGIRTPGTRIRLGRVPRLIIWTLIAPAPGFFLGALFTLTLGPREMVTFQRRIIAVHALHASSAHQYQVFTMWGDGKRLAWGTVDASSTAVPLRQMMITSAPKKTGPLIVTLPSQQCEYRDFTGTTVTATFNAAAIEKWMNANGINDPLAAELASEVHEVSATMNSYIAEDLASSHRTVRGLTSVNVKASRTTIRSNPQLERMTIAAIVLLVWLCGALYILPTPRRSRGLSFPSPHPFATAQA